MLFCLIGFFGITILGSMLHFVYDIAKHNKKISWLVAVNESTWEHLKLAVVPTLMWAMVGLFVPNLHNFYFGVFIAVIGPCFIIPFIFYTYTAFTKRPILTVDISSFVVSIGLSCFSAYFVFNLNPLPNWVQIIGIVGTILLSFSFVIFTYFPPRHFLFQDPISQKYGVKGHFDDESVGNHFSFLKHK